jgi:hypothetical protein
MLPGILGPLLIFAFILRSESAHRGCPYHELTRRSLGPGLFLVEERRSCLPDIEERRYTLLRGATTRRLGERRFAREAYARGHYAWTAKSTAEGEVQIRIHNDGHPDALFREGTPEEHEKGISH